MSVVALALNVKAGRGTRRARSGTRADRSRALGRPPQLRLPRTSLAAALCNLPRPSSPQL